MSHHRHPRPPTPPVAVPSPAHPANEHVASVVPLFREEMHQAGNPSAREEVYIRYLERALDTQSAANVELHGLATAVRAAGGQLARLSEVVKAQGDAQIELSRAIAAEIEQRRRDARDEAEARGRILVELANLHRTDSRHDLAIGEVKQEQLSLKQRLLLAGFTPQNLGKGFAITLLTIVGNLIAAYVKGHP